MAFLGDRGKYKENKADSFRVMSGMEREKKSQSFNNGMLGFNNLLCVKINNVLCYLSPCGTSRNNFGIFVAVTRKCH